MSNERDSFNNLEMGTSAENDYDRNNEVDVEVDDEPSGAAPKKNQVSNEVNGDEDGFDEEEDGKEELYQPVTQGKNLYYDEDEEAHKRRNKLAIAAIAFILLFAVLLALALVFKQDNGDLKGLVISTAAPSSGSITSSAPTDSPTTKSPTTRAPTAPTPLGNTMSPTAAPFAPTFGGPRPVSRLPCDEIRNDPNVTGGNLGDNNFEIYTLNHGVQVCGDTYAGFDGSKTKRNFWQATIGRRDCVLLDFHTGTFVCENAGARRCTADELAQKAAQGSGCGGDNFMLYTSTTCKEGGKDGYLQINLSLKNGGTFFQCQTDLTDTTITRCCGDIFEA